MMDMRLCSAFRNVKGFFDVGAAIAFGEQLGDLFFAFAEAVRACKERNSIFCLTVEAV